MKRKAKKFAGLFMVPESLLKIGNRSIQCYVLDDGTAVLSGRGMQDALGLGNSHGGKLRDLVNNLECRGLIYSDLVTALDNPVKFTRPGRGASANGYEATILTKLYRAILSIRNFRLRIDI